MVLATNIGVGSLNNKQNHGGITFKTLEKGFYESGVLVNNLIKLNFTTFGVAAYYRYGPYHFDKQSDNFTVKMSLGYSF